MAMVRQLSERFWFVPAVLCLAASGAALALVAVDRVSQGPVLPGWVDFLFYRVGSSGSRDLLGAIATSSLAVAGTTFSITMAVLALTSSSYGPRLVRNFMTDKGNQVVLGVYVATFLYCLLVLRSVRVIGDPGQQDAEVFVPHLAVNGAVLLAIANVGVLIYFIHHISDSIQVATLASGVRRDVLKTVERLYPEDLGPSEGDAEVPDLSGDAMTLTADRAGYVQSVGQDALMRAAHRHDLVLELKVTPGDYVLPDSALLLVRPRGGPGRGEGAHAAIDGMLLKRLRRALLVTDARTPHQDIGFALQQLTEMAVRALSPGTNDPYTASNAVDDLSAGLSVLASRPVPSPWRRDDDGVVRVRAPRPDVVELVDTSLNQLRWYGADAPAFMHSCVRLVERVSTRARREDDEDDGDEGGVVGRGDDRRQDVLRLQVRLLAHLDLLSDAFTAAGHHVQDQARFDDDVRRARDVVLRRIEEASEV